MAVVSAAPRGWVKPEEYTQPRELSVGCGEQASPSEALQFLEVIVVGMLWRATGMGLLLILLSIGKAPAVTDIMEGAEVQADPEAVKAIRATFDRAEEALRTKSLSGITAIYSKDYRHRGLRKEDTARMWEDIFKRYDRLSSRHFFSKIVVDPKKATAQVTCTGTLYGVLALNKAGKPSRGGVSSEPIHIDIWFDANHYLVLEDGTWKIIGHDPRGGEEDRLGAAIHLLF